MNLKAKIDYLQFSAEMFRFETEINDAQREISEQEDQLQKLKEGFCKIPLAKQALDELEAKIVDRKNRLLRLQETLGILRKET